MESILKSYTPDIVEEDPVISKEKDHTDITRHQGVQAIIRGVQIYNQDYYDRISSRKMFIVNGVRSVFDTAKKFLINKRVIDSGRSDSYTLAEMELIIDRIEDMRLLLTPDDPGNSPNQSLIRTGVTDPRIPVFAKLAVPFIANGQLDIENPDKQLETQIRDQVREIMRQQQIDKSNVPE